MLNEKFSVIFKTRESRGLTDVGSIFEQEMRVVSFTFQVLEK